MTKKTPFNVQIDDLLKEIKSHSPEEAVDHIKDMILTLERQLDKDIAKKNIEQDPLPNGWERMAEENRTSNPYSAVSKKFREKKQSAQDIRVPLSIKVPDGESHNQKLAEEKGYESRNKDGGVKNDAKKPRMNLVPTLAQVEVARVMTYGAQKYAAFNWMEGFDWTVLMDAAERHIAQWKAGSDIDVESKLSHLGHAMCCLMMLYDTTKLHPTRDDRSEQYKKYAHLVDDLMTMDK